MRAKPGHQEGALGGPLARANRRGIPPASGEKRKREEGGTSSRRQEVVVQANNVCEITIERPF